MNLRNFLLIRSLHSWDVRLAHLSVALLSTADAALLPAAPLGRAVPWAVAGDNHIWPAPLLLALGVCTFC